MRVATPERNAATPERIDAAPATPIDWPICDFVLVTSTPSAGGSRYTVAARWLLR